MSGDFFGVAPYRPCIIADHKEIPVLWFPDIFIILISPPRGPKSVSINGEPNNKPKNIRNSNKLRGPEPALAPSPKFASFEPAQPVSLQLQSSAHHDSAIDQKVYYYED